MGIVWTDDNWKTAQKSYAHFERMIDSQTEKWTLTAGPFDFVIIFRANTLLGPIKKFKAAVEFGAFVIMNGNTYWNANNNHKVCRYLSIFILTVKVDDPVSEERPIQLLHSRLLHNDIWGVYLEGVIRSADAFPRGPILSMGLVSPINKLAPFQNFIE